MPFKATLGNKNKYRMPIPYTYIRLTYGPKEGRKLVRKGFFGVGK